MSPGDWAALRSHLRDGRAYQVERRLLRREFLSNTRIQNNKRVPYTVLLPLRRRVYRESLEYGYPPVQSHVHKTGAMYLRPTVSTGRTTGANGSPTATLNTAVPATIPACTPKPRTVLSAWRPVPKASPAPGAAYHTSWGMTGASGNPQAIKPTAVSASATAVILIQEPAATFWRRIAYLLPCAWSAGLNMANRT